VRQDERRRRGLGRDCWNKPRHGVRGRGVCIVFVSRTCGVRSFELASCSLRACGRPWRVS
jgi:hypothetical protein